MIQIKVSNNKIQFVNKQAEENYNKILSAYNNTGKVLSLDIKEFSKNITDKQYTMWKALIMAGVEKTGYSYSETEAELVNKFSPYIYVDNIFGEKEKVRKNISEMNNKEFSEFFEQCVAFMKEFFNIDFV